MKKTRNDNDNILTCIPKSKEEIENMLELDEEIELLNSV